MNALVLVEIITGILLALGIAIASLYTFIRGKDNRPGLLIGSSTVAVVLLVVCLVCTGIQMNRLSSEEPETEVETLAQVRAESVVKEEKKTDAVDIKEKSTRREEADKAKKEKARDLEEAAEREKREVELLADFFGGSSEKTNKTSEADEVKTLLPDIGSVNTAVFTVGIPVYSDEDENNDFYPMPEDVSYDDPVSAFETEYEQDDVYGSENDYSDDLLAGFFSGSAGNDAYDPEDYLPDYGYDDQSQYDTDYTGYDDYDGYDYSETEYGYVPENDYNDYDYPDYSEMEPVEEYPDEAEKTEPEYVWSGSVLSRGSGVNYGPLGLETYYNMDMSGVVGLMRTIGFSEEEYPYYVREDGCKMLGGYVMVAANFGQFSRGDVVQCSLGPALVCDTGAGGWNWLDIATNW